MLDEKRKELRTKAYKRICDKAKLIPIWDSSFSAIKIITLQSLKRGRVILREESDLIRSLGQSGLCGLGFTDGGQVHLDMLREFSAKYYRSHSDGLTQSECNYLIDGEE